MTYLSFEVKIVATGNSGVSECKGKPENFFGRIVSKLW